MKKNNIKTIIGAILIVIAFVAIVASAIWALVFHLMNPDMTELRLFLENPYPTIICIVSVAGLMVGKFWLGVD
jgi:hypothetical protein